VIRCPLVGLQSVDRDPLTAARYAPVFPTFFFSTSPV
jgi:hypothetical protein